MTPDFPHTISRTLSDNIVHAILLRLGSPRASDWAKCAAITLAAFVAPAKDFNRLLLTALSTGPESDSTDQYLFPLWYRRPISCQCLYAVRRIVVSSRWSIRFCLCRPFQRRGRLWVTAPLNGLALTLTHPEIRLSLGVLFRCFFPKSERKRFLHSSMMPTRQTLK